MRKIPIYLFTGFLEGGKTHIIQESLSDSQFNTGEKTMVIQCEEGIDELDPSTFASNNVYLEHIENEADLTPDLLLALSKKHKLDRVMIEYNGMWQMNTLYAAIPDAWGIFQEMMFADANTFLVYNANMRQQMVDKLMNAEMVILSRTPANIDKMAVHKIVRGVSRRCAISYDYPDGHVENDEIEDPLPFDINADVIEIGDGDYAVWYRDLTEETDKYIGKTVRFKGIVARDRSLGKNAIVVGRHIMTCCQADIAYHGLVCNFDRPIDLEQRAWIVVTAKIALETHKLYGGKGPVLHAVDYAMTTKPNPEVATYY